MPGLALGQNAPDRFFVDPVLILGGGGHHATVRSMAFSTTTGSQLLTGGMDKVVHVWNLDADRSGPARTLRPPNWRGYRGQINALALSRPDAAGNRLLAVAGYGVLGDLGEILLFRYPNEGGQGTGEIVGQLSAAPAQPGRPARPGHTGVVTSVAFTPDGRFLASASNDHSVRIWDVAGRMQVQSLRDSNAEILAMAVFADGTRLVAGGEERVLRLYDITNPARPLLLGVKPSPGRPALFPQESRINCVAASPDGRWVVAGTEGSRLIRYDGATLAGDSSLKAVDDPLAGAVLALASNADGTRLASSTITRALGANPAGFPAVSCVVEVRSMPDGAILERLPPTTNLVHALAFSPDGRRLAYSGGDAQAVYVKELIPNSPAPDELKGKGASLWDVGFRADGRAVRFARSRPNVPGQAANYEHFDLRGRFFFNPGPGEATYRHAVTTGAGWTIRPVDNYQFDFLSGPGVGWRVGLNPANERRWWAYTVIPPGDGHPDPVAAVAADAGVVLWNLRTGVKTRSLSGHAGPVYSLATSSDGRWLLTGSSDQTVRLWPLAGCDRLPEYGARFERRAEGWVIADITPGGFADGIALKPGYVVEAVEVGDFGPPVNLDPALILPRLDGESPTKFITITARVPGQAERFKAGSTKRDSPALTLFPGVDRRWVLWTPRGYYDSSADGDRRFLGWLTNRGTVAQLLAGTFDSIDKFEARFRQPKVPGNVLDRLLDTADPLRAVAAPAPANAANPAAPGADPTPRRMEALPSAPAAPAPGDRPVAVAAPTLRVNYRATAATGASLIRELWIEVNGRRVQNLIAANAAPRAAEQGQFAIPVGVDRDVRASLVAVDALGVRRVESLDLSNQAPPAPDARKSRLIVVAIGTARFAEKRLSPVEHAEDDARDLAKFLERRLVDPSTGSGFASGQAQVHPLLGPEFARSQVVATLDELRGDAQAGKVGDGDVVALVVESHFLDFRSRKLLATAEPLVQEGELPALSASDLTDRLGELSRLGCRVLVLLDAVHAIQGEAFDNDIREWVRQLQSQANALAFIAADHGPSRANGVGHRVFAQGILDALKVGSSQRPKKPGEPFTLLDFERAVVNDVLDKTGRRQHAQLYLPETLSYPVPFLDPSPRR